MILKITLKEAPRTSFFNFMIAVSKADSFSAKQYFLIDLIPGHYI